MYQILLFVPLLLMVAIGTYLYKNRRIGRIDSTDPANLPPHVTMHAVDNSISLSCVNVKKIYLMFGTLLWFTAIFFIIMAITEIKNQPIALQARVIIDAITSWQSWKYAPFAFIAIILYIIYSRTKITWDNGLLIGDQPADILHFEIKRVTGTGTFLYLQTKDKLWILMPVTSEELKRFKNINVLNRELASNKTQIQHLKHNFMQLGAQEKRYNLFIKYLAFGFVAFLGAAIFFIIMFT